MIDNVKITVIGLGYVGLPLAALFAKKYAVVGFDTHRRRVQCLKKYDDTTFEIPKGTLQRILKSTPDNNKGLYCSNNLSDIGDSNYYIITVPTPVDSNKEPILTPLIKASQMVGKYLKKGDIVVYESTVYPGVTEEECVPILEKTSGLVFNKDFFAGYSPERISPGDKKNTVENILKITSGSTKTIAKKIDTLYKSIIKAGTYLAPSIKIAEAAKVIENAQRDVNIAFVNELSRIFNLLKINTKEVLKAANTKWNFLPFQPGLVGGHCIGVDPYYLARKAQKIGYNPQLILTGRRINDSMGFYVGEQVIKLMVQKNILVKNAKILILGFTFKENCPDIRNTKVADIIYKLQEFNTNITIYDPWIKPVEIKKNYKLNVINTFPKDTYNAIVLAVAHRKFKLLDIEKLKKNNAVVYDVKSVLNEKSVDLSL